MLGESKLHWNCLVVLVAFLQTKRYGETGAVSNKSDAIFPLSAAAGGLTGVSTTSLRKVVNLRWLWLFVSANLPARFPLTKLWIRVQPGAVKPPLVVVCFEYYPVLKKRKERKKGRKTG